jgi:hypothetical protein
MGKSLQMSHESENRHCARCKQGFEILSEDFTYYSRIKVPPPTWCPECRAVRRLTWANERSLYKRQCPKCAKEIICRYAPDYPGVVYDHSCWWKDDWDPLDYGVKYDFGRPFFEQYKDLLLRVPHYGTINKSTERCEYCSYAYNSKDCYLSCVVDCQDCAYVMGNELRNCFDVSWAAQLDSSYVCIDVHKSSNLAYCQNVQESSGSRFLFDCINVQNCVGCVGLRNKQYYILNRSYPKEDYGQKLKELNLGSHSAIEDFRQKFEDLKKSFPRCYAHIVRSENVTGDNIVGSVNSKHCFATLNGLEDSKYLVVAGNNLKDSYDGYDIGSDAELIYEGRTVGAGSSRILFGVEVALGCTDVQYSQECFGSAHLFGCLGLRNQKYCILNKQYSKEEYEQIVPKIIEQMKALPYVDDSGKEYGYGEFFPSELSPYAYNESVAQEYFPNTKGYARAKGYKWRDPDSKGYADLTKPQDLPDNINDVSDSILEEVIGCEHLGACSHQCTSAFKVIPKELAFYRAMELALPRLCPNCRSHERIVLRNPIKLWPRSCQCAGSGTARNGYKNVAVHSHGEGKCPNEFETPYAPERLETVYCRSCYNAEVT